MVTIIKLLMGRNIVCHAGMLTVLTAQMGVVHHVYCVIMRRIWLMGDVRIVVAALTCSR